MFISAFRIWNSVQQNFLCLCLMLDSLIYSVISYMYSVFIVISRARILSNSIVTTFSNRIYMIISVVMMFLVAYSFINIIINPDNLTKGKVSTTKLVRNIVLSLVIIVMAPTAFDYAYKVQTSILDNNVISRLILGTTPDEDTESDNMGSSFSVGIFQGFFYVQDDPTMTDAEREQVNSDYEAGTQVAISSNNIYNGYESSLEYTDSNRIQYTAFISGIAGIFILYVLLIYLFDVGLRAIKLVFLQLITPLPALMLIVPGQEKLFSSWVKEVIKTFLEVFIKIAILTFGIFIIKVINTAVTETNIFWADIPSGVRNWSKIFLVLGTVMFIKQAPKLVESLFGVKVDNAGGLRSRIKDSGLGLLGSGVDRVAGAGLGIIASKVANRKAAAARLKPALESGDITKDQFNQLVKKEGGFKAGALGAYYGFRGGVRQGVGNAYNAGFDTQHYKANGLGTFDVAKNLARDNFGLQSYYEEEVKKSKIENDAVASVANRKAAVVQQAIAREQRRINNEYDDLITANDLSDSKMKNVKDLIASKNGKIDSDIKADVLTVDYDSKSNRLVLKSASMNRAEIEKSQAELTQKLIDQGMSESDAIKVRDLVTTAGSGTSEKSFRDKLFASGASVNVAIHGQGDGVTFSTIGTYKDQTDAVDIEYVNQNLNKDADLRNALAELAKAFDNKLVGKAKLRLKVDSNGSPIQGSDGKYVIAQPWEKGIIVSEDNYLGKEDLKQQIIDSGYYKVYTDLQNSGGAFRDGNTLFELFDSMKGFSSKLQSDKKAETVNTEITVPVLDEQGNPDPTKSTETISINQGELEVDKQRKIVKEAEERQKLKNDSFNGLKNASDAAANTRKYMSKRKPKGKN